MQRVQRASDETETGSGAAPEPGHAERFLPDEMRGGLVETEHLSRYVLAAGLANGRAVLDVACGSGYGGAMLARAGASRVVGVDTDTAAAEQVVDHCEFVTADIAQLPFADGEFDLVVSFETVEHVATPDGAIAELTRVTDPEKGILLLSSPNRGVYPPGNPFHQRELTADELLAAVGDQFANVRALRQHNWVTTAILGDEAFRADTVERRLAADVRKVWAAEPGDELYSIVIASNAELPEIDALVLMTRGLEVRQWIEELERQRARVDDAAQRLATQREYFDLKVADLEERVAWVEEHELYLKGLADRSRLFRAMLAAWARLVRVGRAVKRRLK